MEAEGCLLLSLTAEETLNWTQKEVTVDCRFFFFCYVLGVADKTRFVFFFRNIHRCRGFPLDQMDRLEAPLFKRMFSVDRETFDFILDKIEVNFTSNEAKATNISGQPVVLKTRLAVNGCWLSWFARSYIIFV
jgi:hypothetical protein